LKSLGISITRNTLSAFLWEQSLLSSRIEGACAVTCGEPYGGQDDIAHLAEEVRKIAGTEKIPPAVISLPPAWTFVRRVSLPVGDLPRAKKMHIAELEGNLPIEDEEILSDILPSPAGETGTFLAIAARRSAVEKTVAAFSGAGFRLDRTITDHVALLCAVLSTKNGFSGVVISDRNDFLALRISGGGVASARQFPETLSGNNDALREGIREIAGADRLAFPSQTCVVLGDLPHPLTDILTDTEPFVLPAGAEDASPLAYGAAISPFFGKETGGFSLRTSAEAESERTRQQSWFRIAAIAAAIAILAASGSLGVARWAEAKKVSRIRAEIRKEFREAVPGATVSKQEMAQIREKVRSLTRQSKELGSDFPLPTSMLGKASQALPAKGTISVREVSFDAGRLRIEGDAKSAQDVEKYRAALVEAFGQETRVTVEEAEGSAQGGKVRYTILIEKGKNDRAA
jgi:type II secretion system protein L